MKNHRFWAWAMVFCLAMTVYTAISISRRTKRMIDCFKCKKIGLFLGGVLVGTAGVKIL